TAHEAALLGRHEDGLADELAAPNHDAVIELLGQVEQIEVRAGFALLRSDELLEAADIEQQSNSIAGGGLVPARRLVPDERRPAHLPSPSTSRPAWASRKATVSARAPPSLIESFRPPGDRRSTKSVTTASHTTPKPMMGVLTSTWHSVSG